MKVNFIELTNFRGIQKQRITFENKNFVALIGDNGSGKTTILEAITKGFVPVSCTFCTGTTITSLNFYIIRAVIGIDS